MGALDRGARYREQGVTCAAFPLLGRWAHVLRSRGAAREEGRRSAGYQRSVCRDFGACLRETRGLGNCGKVFSRNTVLYGRTLCRAPRAPLVERCPERGTRPQAAAPPHGRPADMRFGGVSDDLGQTMWMAPLSACVQASDRLSPAMRPRGLVHRATWKILNM